MIWIHMIHMIHMIHIVTRDHKHKEAPTELVARRTPVGDMKIPDPIVLPAAKLLLLKK